MAHYSTLIFKQELTSDTATQVKNDIKNGTKVFLFAYDPIDDLYEDAFLKQAMDNQFLFAYEVMYDENFNEDFTYYDGEVPQQVMDFLEKKALYFNVEQYLVEHAPLDGNIIVSAGAGTGKTTVMISRILFLKYKNPELNPSSTVNRHKFTF